MLSYIPIRFDTYERCSDRLTGNKMRGNEWCLGPKASLGLASDPKNKDKKVTTARIPAPARSCSARVREVTNSNRAFYLWPISFEF